MILLKKHEAIQKVLESDRVIIYFEEYRFFSEVDHSQAVNFICGSWKHPNIYIHDHGDQVHVSTYTDQKVKNEVTYG